MSLPFSVPWAPRLLRDSHMLLSPPAPNSLSPSVPFPHSSPFLSFSTCNSSMLLFFPSPSSPVLHVTVADRQFLSTEIFSSHIIHVSLFVSQSVSSGLLLKELWKTLSLLTKEWIVGDCTEITHPLTH